MINDLEKIWRKRRNDFCQVLKLVKTSSNNFNSIIQAWKQSNVEAEDFFDVMLSFASLQIRNFSNKSCHSQSRVQHSVETSSHPSSGLASKESSHGVQHFPDVSAPKPCLNQFPINTFLLSSSKSSAHSLIILP